MRVRSKMTGYTERVRLCRTCTQKIVDNTIAAKKEIEYQKSKSQIITDDPIQEKTNE